jgi:hypothetical protein
VVVVVVGGDASLAELLGPPSPFRHPMPDGMRSTRPAQRAAVFKSGAGGPKS